MWRFLFADVFEKFRNNNLKNYALCPSRYLRASALSWDAMLKMTKTKLELFSDPNMYIDVEFLVFLINIAEPTIFKILWSRIRIKHITYLDMNNLYGYAMSKFLPTGGFKWIDPKEFDLNKYTTNHSKGHVLEFGHEYPKKLH